MSSFAKEAAAGGGSGASVASTGSVAVSVVEDILDKNGIEIDSDGPLNSQQQADAAAASAQAIDAAIGRVEPSRQWQEIVALIKVYGGWAGAALAVAINSYLVTNKGTIQDLIAALPDMLSSILSNPNIPGYVANFAGTAVKATAAIVFMRALISYLSANPSTVFDDMNKVNDDFMTTMKSLNPSIDEGGITEDDLVRLRSNQLKFTKWNVTGKTKIIVDTALNPETWKTIGDLCKVPFTYIREARTVLATYFNGRVEDLQSNLFSMDSSESGSIDSHNSLWEKLINEGKATPLLVEPAAGGGRAAGLEIEPGIQAQVLQVVLPQEKEVVEETRQAINDEIGNVLVEGGAGGGDAGSVPAIVFLGSDSQSSTISKITDPGDGDDADPDANARSGNVYARSVDQRKKRQEQFRRGRSEPSSGSDTLGGFGVGDFSRRHLYGPEHPLANRLPSNSQQDTSGGKKRNSKRKTKKAKRTKKRSKKLSKRKTRR
jgi:hypothetical protein